MAAGPRPKDAATRTHINLAVGIALRQCVMPCLTESRRLRVDPRSRRAFPIGIPLDLAICTCAQRKWAYGRSYHLSRQRTARLPHWVHEYDWHRAHSSRGDQPPISRLQLAGGNVLRLHN